MEEWDQLLRWLHRDLLDERLRQACGQWILLSALGFDPSRDPLPAGLALSTAMAPQADAEGAAPPVVFPLPEGPAPVQVFGLWLLPPADAQPDGRHPLVRECWRFWVVPGRQVHPDRRSMGLNPLRRAHGEGCSTPELADRLRPLLLGDP